MPPPRSPDARRFYRAGLLRFDEAKFLLDNSEYTTAAVYLGGYAVECLFKALIPGQVTSDIGEGLSSSGLQVPSLGSGTPSLSAPSGPATPPPSSLGGLLGAVQQQAGGSK